MKKTLSILLGFLVMVTTSLAQSRVLTGIVTDSNTHETLISATVYVKGKTSLGTTTNLDGKYTLKGVNTGDVVVFSFIGYTTKEIKLGNQRTLDVSLTPNTKQLDQVVVTALGIKRSTKALSYNVQEIKGNVVNDVKDANFVNALNGKVAGVNIQKSASGVGGGVKVVMRGNKSILGSNNVLYVIDGIPVGNNANVGGDGSGFGGSAVTDGVSSINPDDIESISVLTGPSAAALYGAAAANGVILINTKKGKEGTTRVNFSSSVETMHPFILPRLQTTYGQTPGTYTSWGPKLATPSHFSPNQFFQTGTIFNNSFDLSTGTKNNQTYVSAAAVNSKGIVPNNNYHRYNATIRNTAEFFNNKMTLDASASYSREFSNNMVSYGTYFNPIVGVYLYPVGLDFNQAKYFERYNASRGIYTQYWAPGDFGMDIQNPYWIAYRNLRPVVNDRYVFYARLKYDFTDYLNVALRGRLDNTYTQSEDKRYASTINTFAGPNGRYSYSETMYKQKYFDAILNLNKSFATDYHVVMNIGTSAEEYDMKGRGYGGELLSVPNLFSYTNVDPTKASPNENGGNSRKRNFAIFGSAELSWQSAVYLTLTGRTDESSVLINSQDPWIFYPSVGLSTIVTQLLSDNVRNTIRPVISYLKLRTSYTEVGSPIPFTGITPGTETHKLLGGVVQPFEYYPVPNLKAERTKSFEFGLDTRLFNDILTLNATVYHSNTYNQLLKADLPKTSGYNYMFVQSGNVMNQGLELTLGINGSIGDFHTNTSITATHNENKIIKLAGQVKNPIDGKLIDLSKIYMGRFVLEEGGEIGTMYANQRIKRDKFGAVEYNPGGVLVTESTDPYILGSVNPKWLLGFSQSFSYKGLNLSFLINARLGGIVISKTQAVLDKYGVSQASAVARNNGGINLGKGLLIPAEVYYSSIYNLDAYNVYSATNVRLQQARLAYTVPSKWLDKYIKRITLAVYGNNLLMIYNKAPYDPELTAGTGTFGQGYDYFMQPSQRSIGFSLNLGF